MKRLAIFVEGQTEQLFLSKLLREIAGQNNIVIDELKWGLNKKGNRCFMVISASPRNSAEKFHVLIYDCGGESTVQTDIRDNYASLAAIGYQKILGLRDVYPKYTFSDIPELERRLKFRVPTSPIAADIILAIMEVEAWFLAETTHFLQIHPSLSVERISKYLNFNPTTDDVEQRACPSNDLNSIYHLERFGYNKRKSNCKRTVEALDCSEVYLRLSKKINSLHKFIKELDSFFS